MILKGNQRAGGADLATHLLNEFDNEQVRVADIRGTVARDLHGAFAEFDAAACGTRCKEPLYSLSINPPSPLTREQYSAAIDRIEHGLGLNGLPRAVVFHVKHGREHCHVVWSRIDTRTMRAAQLSHDRMKLRALSRELSRDFGLAPPEGIAKDRSEPRRKDISLAEKAQADATGITPRDRKAAITEAYRGADTGSAFRAALEARGYRLARGDRRAFVVVDRYGHVHSLARQIEGARAKDIKAKLAPLTPEFLPSVEQVRESMARELQAAETARKAKQEERRRAAIAKLEARQRERRERIERQAHEMKTRHMAERLKLHAGQKARKDALIARRQKFNRRGFASVLSHMPGYAVMLRYLRGRQDKAMLTAERRENDLLALRHTNEALEIERLRAALSKVDRRERTSLETQLTRAGREDDRAQERLPPDLSQEFQENASGVSPARDEAKAGRGSLNERAAQMARDLGRKGPGIGPER